MLLIHKACEPLRTLTIYKPACLLRTFRKRKDNSLLATATNIGAVSLASIENSRVSVENRRDYNADNALY